MKLDYVKEQEASGNFLVFEHNIKYTLKTNVRNQQTKKQVKQAHGSVYFTGMATINTSCA